MLANLQHRESFLPVSAAPARTQHPQQWYSAPNMDTPLLTPPPRAEVLLQGLNCSSLLGPCTAAGRTPRLPWQRWHRQGSVSPAQPAPLPPPVPAAAQLQLHLPWDSWSSSCRWSLSASCACPSCLAPPSPTLTLHSSLPTSLINWGLKARRGIQA